MFATAPFLVDMPLRNKKTFQQLEQMESQYHPTALDLVLRSAAQMQISVVRRGSVSKTESFSKKTETLLTEYLCGVNP